MTTPLVANASNIEDEASKLAVLKPHQAGYNLAAMNNPTEAGYILAIMGSTEAGAILATMNPKQAANIASTMPPESVAKILATMSNTTTASTLSTPSNILYAMGSTNAGKVADAFERIADSLAQTAKLSNADKRAMNDAIASAINELKYSIPPFNSTGENPATTNIYVQFIANIQAAIQNGQVGTGSNKLSKADINAALTEIGLATGCTVSLSPNTPVTCH